MEEYYWIITLIIVIVFAIYVYIHEAHKDGKTFSFLKNIPWTRENKEKIQTEKEELDKVRIWLAKSESQLHSILDNSYLNYTKYIGLRNIAKNIDWKYWKYVKKLAWEFSLFYWLLNNDTFAEDHNTDFLINEKVRCINEFWNLTPSQQEAIFSDEDSILVNAWAWTWKTKTIENKVKYLYKEKKIPLKDILVVTYSKKSQEDMMERICKTLESEKIPFNKDELKETISTFHAFWKKILDDYERRYHTVNDWKTIWKWSVTKHVMEDDEQIAIVNKTLSIIKNNPEIFSKIFHYFFYYDKQIIIETDYDEESDKKNRPLNYPSFLRNWTKSNVIVKSYWELLIANYLAEHWIKWVYESKEFHYTDRKWNQSSYKPDFYIPISEDDWVFIEYFWVDENEKAAPRINEDDYVENMQSKIKQHKQSKSKFIDIRYADLKQWRWYFLEKLEKNLNNYWINTSNHINVDQNIVKEEINNLWRVLSSFLALYSECRLSNKIINERIEKLPKWEKERAIRFYEIFQAYHKVYKSLLEKNNIMDFCDMIVWAISYLHSWYVKREYKYILVDEFQDISKARADLLRELIKDHNKTKLFCVWDDWQSIYKFTWSELGIFLDFDKYFWYTKHITLPDTFRFNQWISDISWAFIQTNPNQIKKSLHAQNPKTKDRFMILWREQKEDEKPYRDVIKNIFEEKIADFTEKEKERYKTEKCNITCLYLTRYTLKKYHFSIFSVLKKCNENPEIEDDFFIYDIPSWWYNFRLKIKPLTVHGSKGLEADYVIVDHVNWGNSFSFPSSIDDDPVLNLCMVDDQFAYPYAEERRLFYVAITRWINKAYIIHDKYRSMFVRDIKTLLWWWELRKNATWPHCGKCWWDLIILNSMTWEYACINWCEWKYFAFNWYLYKAPICNCWKAYSVLKRNHKTGEPFWPCSTFPKCWKFHKFREKKYRIWKL